MPTDEPMPRSNLDSDIKIRQLQQYLHCPGRIPTAPHPFVKHAARQAALHQRQSQRLSTLGQRMAHWRDCLALGGGVAYDVITVGVPAVITSLLRRIGDPEKRRVPPQPRLLDADNQAAFVQRPRSGLACSCCSKPHNKL